ncbi:hypothetical protein Taro_011256 [Colocasia esculenta]|uniref:Non-haem dioxygenase N-terminal domain-containing protein n=1 Tax=Colocasia esculenta TaxID=4460 RepID=A0A843UA46_COLES|nr:hypothetical protein [Colocasia esculenta]
MLASTPFPPPEFHAPPPSPEGVERSGKAGEDEVLEEFLSRGDNAAAVPELVLPDRLFPRQIHSADPPEVDFRSLGAPSSIEDLRSAARTIGCFQLVNHGIPREVIAAAEQAAAAVLLLPPDKKALMATSSSAGRCGFEGDGEGRDEELFWWSRGGEGRFVASEEEMAGIWPDGYRDFSCKMARLQREVGKIASEVGQVLFSKGKLETLQVTESVKRTAEAAVESTLHINKFRQGQGCLRIGGSPPNALQHDALRLLIRSCEHPHALCIHVTRCTGFQVFSKRGWVSLFQPNNEALVVTIGNQMPAWKGSSYRHVAGKPVFHAKDEASVSVAVLYSCTTMEKVCTTINGDDEKKTISLAQQAILALSLTLLYHIVVYLCRHM